jgi:transcriptional regulator with XRE-family HTH domain
MDESVINRRLGRRIARLREQAGLTQQELAEKVDVTQQLISLIETGKRNRAWRVDELGRFARALGVTTDELTADLGYSGQAVAVTGGAGGERSRAGRTHAGPIGGGTREVVRGNNATSP